MTYRLDPWNVMSRSHSMDELLAVADAGPSPVTREQIREATGSPTSRISDLCWAGLLEVVTTDGHRLYGLTPKGARAVEIIRMLKEAVQ